MLETPAVITVMARDLRHRMRELRREVANGAVIRIIDGVRPDEPPLYLTAETRPGLTTATPRTSALWSARAGPGALPAAAPNDAAEAQRLMQINLDGVHHD